MKYYIKKYQEPYLPLNKNYPTEITDLFMLGKYKEFEDAKKAYDEYYGKILPEVEIAASKTTPTKTSNWTSEHNVAEDSKKYEQAHQAGSLKIASAVNHKMHEVGNKIGLGMTAAVGAGYLAPATMAGWSAFSAAHPLIASGVDGALAGHGIYNLFGENGILKTYNHFKNGEIGKGVLSGTVDALDVMGGVGLFNRTRLGITTLKNLTSPDNIGKNFLIPAGDFVRRHPNLSNKIVSVVKPNSKYIKAINLYNLDRAHYSGTDATLNGVFVTPRNVGGMPVSFYNAINDGRYLPAMSFALKKKYILDLKNNYADVIENHTLPANKEHILQEELKVKAEADRRVLKEIELSNELKFKTIDDYITESIRKKPKLILNNKYNGVYYGQYSPWLNTVTLVTKTDGTNHILKDLGDRSPDGIDWVTAHELDHWILLRFPKVLNIARAHPNGYYHINQNPHFDFILDFPNLKNVPYNEWYSSPHEWRSELAGFMRANNAPKDVSKWDASLRSDFNTFMDRRFRSTAEDVKQHTGQSLGDFTLDMFTKGYKQGGSIHIKEKNRGSFTKYCKGKVTGECIRKGKNSPNPKIRKKATFAANARKWKHLNGGSINYLNIFTNNKLK